MSKIIFAFLIILTSFTTFAQNKKEIIGYYPSWKYYERNNLLKPSNIKYDRLTTINYSFFAPDANGYIKGTDAWADTILLKGEHDWNKGGYLPNTSLVDLAHQNSVKVFISLGGWTLSTNFSGIAADPVKRTRFANECVKLIKNYNIDGIDVDWEYPGFAAHGGTPADKPNYTLFLKAIRDALDKHTLGTKKYYYLTAALSANPAHIANLELDKIVNLLDMFNIMTYDLAGTWDPISGHNSPLYASAQGAAAFSWDAAFKLYRDTYKIPASKINLGIAFYGYSYKDCKSVFATHTGGDLLNFPNDNAAPTYVEICEKKSLYNRYWDEKAKVPYLVGKTMNSFVSYDDEESIGLKAQYVLDNNARGVIIWEITGDYIDKNTTPLQDKIVEVFNANARVISSVEESSLSEGFKIFPNPTSDISNIQYILNENSFVNLSVYDLSGRLVKTFAQENQEAGTHKYVFDQLQYNIKADVYFIKLDVNGKNLTKKIIQLK